MQSNLRKLNKSYILFCALLFLYLLAFWPGIMCYDGMTQLLQIKQLSFTDHNPPIMGLVWLMLLPFGNEAAVMFIFHSALYTLACLTFMTTIKNRSRYWYALMLYMPAIFSYSMMIVKDVGFAFSFLLSSAIITYIIIEQPNKRNWLLIIATIFLYYGSAVKFQAKFVQVPLAFGIAYCYSLRFNKATVLRGLFISLSIYLSVLVTNSLLTKNVSQNSWQYVKLYDLAAISVVHDHEFFPEHIKKGEFYNFKRIKKDFDQREVDSLVYVPDPPLPTTNNSHELQDIKNLWKKTIAQYPVTYFLHRYKLWKCNIINSPAFKRHPADFFLETKIGPIVAIPIIYNSIGSLFMMLQELLKFVWYLPALMIFTIIGIIYFKDDKYARALFFITAPCIVMLGVLFFFSMAGNARYVYICHVLLGASYPVFFTFIRNKFLLIR